MTSVVQVYGELSIHDGHQASGLRVGRLVVGPGGNVTLGTFHTPFAGEFDLSLDAALLPAKDIDAKALPAVQVDGVMALFASAATASTGASRVSITSATKAKLAVRGSRRGGGAAAQGSKQSAKVDACMLAAALAGAQSCAGGACSSISVPSSSFSAAQDAHLTLQGVTVDLEAALPDATAGGHRLSTKHVLLTARQKVMLFGSTGMLQQMHLCRAVDGRQYA